LNLKVSRFGSFIEMFTCVQFLMRVVPFSSVGAVKFKAGAVASTPKVLTPLVLVTPETVQFTYQP
jgi:hypothetical protein